jgi:hypothetical protein
MSFSVILFFSKIDDPGGLEGEGSNPLRNTRVIKRRRRRKEEEEKEEEEEEEEEERSQYKI